MSVSLDHAQQMMEKGEKIEQEFAEYFTGKPCVSIMHQLAIDSY